MVNQNSEIYRNVDIIELGGKANIERRIDGCCDFQRANIQGLKKVSQTCGSGNKQTKIRGKKKKKKKNNVSH